MGFRVIGYRGDQDVQSASISGVSWSEVYRSEADFYRVAGTKIPTWITPLVLIVVTSVLIPNTSFLGHMCAVTVGYLCKSSSDSHKGLSLRCVRNHANVLVVGLGYLKFLAPPERILRWIEGKLNLLGRLPHYVSVDQKQYGRFGILPQTDPDAPTGPSPIGMTLLNSGGQRLGP